jgi:5-methylcytosine-specific restriction endonuclease McrA
MQSSWIRNALASLLSVSFLALSPVDVLARGSGRSSVHTSRSSSASSHHRALSSSRSSIKCESCPRDSHGKIERDPNAKSEFKRTNPKPPGCAKCEVDHIVPLSKGGRDEPSNMQWLPKARHQDKTKRDLQP